MFAPTNEKPKCVTYVRKNIGLLPEIHQSMDNYALSITITLENKRMEVINIYAPTKTEAMRFLLNHHPLPDTLLAGDFNIHHTGWYGP